MDCLKDNTPPFKQELQKKLDPGYVKLNALHHLKWKQGQEARRKCKMGQRIKAREKFQTPIFKEMTQGLWSIRTIRRKRTLSHLIHWLMFKWDSLTSSLVGRQNLKVSKALLPNSIKIRCLMLMFHRNHTSKLLQLPLRYIQQGVCKAMWRPSTYHSLPS